MNGYGERCGNANLISIIPNLQLKLGYECVTDRQLESLTPTAHFFDELLNLTPERRSAVRRAQRVRAQGGDARGGGRRGPVDLRAHRSGDRRQRPRGADLRAVGQGDRAHARRRGRDRDRRCAARRGWSSGSRSSSTAATTTRPPTARSSCCCARRPANTSRCSGSRRGACIVEKRSDGRVETEATIKIWVGGERYVRTAEGNGPVHALDRALREALVEIHPQLREIELVNFKVRILDETKGTDAVTRVLLDASDGERVWGSIGVSENVIESSWEALVDSLEYGMQPGRRDRERAGRREHRSARDRGSAEPIPMAQPVIGPEEEQRVLEVLRSGRLSLGPVVPEFEQAFAAAVGAEHAIAVSSGTAGLHLALRAVGVSRRRRGDHDAVLVRRERQRRRLRARDAGVRRHRSGHAQPRSGGGRGGRHRAHGGAAAGARVRLSGRHGRARGAGAADRRGRVRGARSAATPTAGRSAGAVTRRCSASIPTSS